MNLTVPNCLKINGFGAIKFPVVIAIISILYFLVPSMHNSDLEQSTLVTKTIYFTYGLGIAVGIWALNSLFTKDKILLLRISKLDVVLMIYTLYILVNRYTIQDNYGFSLRFIDFMGLIILYFMLRLFEKRSLILISTFIILSGVVQAIYGNLQLFGHYPSLHSRFNISGSYFNPGPYAGFLAIVWTISLGMYLFKENIASYIQSKSIHKNSINNNILMGFIQYTSLVGIVSIVIVLPATRSRAAWLAVIVGSMLLLLNRYSISKWIKSLGIVKSFAILFVCTLTFLAGVFGIYHFKKASADGRVLTWKVSANIIKEHPFFGVGFDRFNAHYMDAQAEYFGNSQNLSEGNVADNTYYAFNEPIQLTVENGFLGLAMAIFIAYSILKIKVRPKEHFFKTICLAVLLSTFVFGLFSYPSQILPIKMIMVYIIAFITTLDKDKISFEIDHSKRCIVGGWLHRPIIIVLIVTSIWKIYPYLKKIENAYRDWKTAMYTYGNKSYIDSLEKFEYANRVLGKEGDFLMNYGKALVMAGKSQEGIVILNNAKNNLNTSIIETAIGDAHKSLGNYIKAERAYKHAADMIPHRFYPHYLLAMLYVESGQVEKAKQKAKEILKKEVKVQSTAIDEIRMEMKRILKNPLGLDAN